MVSIRHTCFPSFGVPLIDELYRMRMRQKATRAERTVHERISLVPEANEQHLLDPHEVERIAKTPEEVA